MALPKPEEKIKRAIQIYRENKNVTRHLAEKVVMSLYLPSAFRRVGKRGKPGKTDNIYEDFVSRYQHDSAYIERTNKQRPGIKRNYQLRVVLFTQAGSKTPKRNRSNKTRRWSESSRRDRASTTEPSTRGCCSTERDT